MAPPSDEIPATLIDCVVAFNLLPETRVLARYKRLHFVLWLGHSTQRALPSYIAGRE
jgi:hypothetical protein